MRKEGRTGGEKMGSTCKSAVEGTFWRLPNVSFDCLVGSRGKLFFYALAQKAAWC